GRARDGVVPSRPGRAWLVPALRPEHRATGGVDRIRVLGHEPGGRPDVRAAVRILRAVALADRGGGGLHLAGPGRTHPGGQAMASLAGGWVVLLTLLVGETDEAFADVYSAAVSSQNIRDRINQRAAVLAVAAAGLILAAWLSGRPGGGAADFEAFLFLLGSV